VLALNVALPDVSRTIQQELAALRLERERLELERLRLEVAHRQAALPNDRLWSEKDAATYLGMSTRWLRDSTVPKALLHGSGKGKRASVRYEPEEVRAWVKARKTHSVIDESVVAEKPIKRRTAK
jgi:hypothetical protein